MGRCGRDMGSGISLRAACISLRAPGISLRAAGCLLGDTKVMPWPKQMRLQRLRPETGSLVAFSRLNGVSVKPLAVGDADGDVLRNEEFSPVLGSGCVCWNCCQTCIKNLCMHRAESHPRSSAPGN